MEATNLTFLEALLATYIEKEEPQVRMVAIQYAGEVFPHTHVPSRYILLLGAGDAKDDVANAAKGHLYGAMNKLNQQGDHGARYQRPSELVRENTFTFFWIDPLFTYHKLLY